MELKFEIYDSNGSLIGKNNLANNFTYDYYKNYVLQNGKMYFEFIPKDNNYKWGRLDFHDKNNKIDESSSPIKITVEHYEMLEKDKNLFDCSSDWKSF